MSESIQHSLAMLLPRIAFTASILPLITILVGLMYNASRLRVGSNNFSPLAEALRACFTPRWVSNLVFTFDAVKVIQDGYEKLHESSLRIVRGDKDVVLLPASLIDELSALPSTVAPPHEALEHDLLGSFTGLSLILESRLHHSILQRRLTPRLPLMVDGLQEELNVSVATCFPVCDEWTQFMPYQLFASVSAALSARTLVGLDLCRDKSWLKISVEYTENLFKTVVILRTLPPWTHKFLCPLLPSYWACNNYIKAAKDLLAPRFQEYLDKFDSEDWRPETTDADLNVLSWLVETAKGEDRNAETLAHVEVILALASVHTILLRLVNVLYDLTANPTLMEDLRKEIETVRCGPKGWTNLSYVELTKLDSAMRESQRMSPPTVLGMKRIFKQDYTFANGIYVPKNTYVCLPIYAIENDPQNNSDPEVFDGLRSYRKRLELVREDQVFQSGASVPKTRSRNPFADDAPFQFSSIDTNTLNFGYGKTACPGRHFASLAIKIVFVKLLTEYEFQFAPGEARPKNITAHEFLFCWPWHEMMIRKRTNSSCPF